MNSDKSQEEVKAMTFEDWDLTHEYKSESVYGAAFDGWHARDAEVLALLEGLKVAKEALEGYAECSDGCTCGDGWSHNSAEAAIKSISTLLTEAQQ